MCACALRSSGSDRGAYGKQGSKSRLLEQGSIENARLDFARFASMCRDTLDVHSKLLHTGLWRLTRAGADQMLSFQELLVAWAPAVKGSAEQRAAFVFSLYDTDASGMLSRLELARMHQDIEVGCVFEHDILTFHSYAKDVATDGRELTIDDYMHHVGKSGECNFIHRLHGLVGSAKAK